MAKLRTRKWLLSAVASLTCLLAAGFYALAQAPDEAKRDRKVAVAGGTFHVLPATLETTQWGWLDPAEPPKLVGQLRRHRRDRDHDARAQQDPARHDDGRDRRAAQGQPRRRAALDDRPDLRQRRRARRRAGDPHPEDRAEGLRRPTSTCPARSSPPSARSPPRCRTASSSTSTSTSTRSRLSSSPASRSTCSRSRARSRSASIPKDPSPRKGGSTDPMAPVSTLRPWKNGSNMDINELQEGSTIYHPGLPEGRARLDGRLALPPGQRRGEPDRARVLVPRDRHAAHRAQGHEAGVAAHRDHDPLDHDRVRRGPEQGHGQRGARDGGLPRRPEDGAADAATRPTRSPRWSATAG